LVRLCQAHPDWLLLWEDGCWFSRFAQPTMNAWSAGAKPLLLHQQERGKRDQEAKAVAGYGGLAEETGPVWLRLSAGQPNRSHTLEFLPYLRQLAQEPAGRGVG